MDFHLNKQWRNQQYESENLHQHQHQHPAKIPKLLSNNLLHETNPQYQIQKPELPSGTGSALPLFVYQPNTTNKISTNLSFHPYSDHSTPTPSTTSRTLPKIGGGNFSMAQWKELELQALIFRYMLAGAAVPAELLQPIKKSINLLTTTTQYFIQQHQHPPHPLHQHYPHFHPASAALLQSGYWGRGAMDPEPGRCRRTDGKKWRCSRDVVIGQKYCERHMHRGRNRSRKPVEIPTHASAGKVAGGGGVVVFSGGGGGTHSALAAVPISSSSASGNEDLIGLTRSSSDVKHENNGLKSDGHVLRHFFDDWPKSLQKPDNAGTTTTTSSMNSSTTSLTISMPGNLSSDVALKLSTGDGEGPGHAEARAHSDRQLGWAAEWGSSPMGGPLAEALRSSNSHSSPTSVLHQLPRKPALLARETCFC